MSGENFNGIDDVGYLEAAGRGEDSKLISVGAVATGNEAEAQNTAHWSVESIVTAQKDAGISTTAREGVQLKKLRQ